MPRIIPSHLRARLDLLLSDIGTAANRQSKRMADLISDVVDRYTLWNKGYLPTYHGTGYDIPVFRDPMTLADVLGRGVPDRDAVSLSRAVGTHVAKNPNISNRRVWSDDLIEQLLRYDETNPYVTHQFREVLENPPRIYPVQLHGKKFYRVPMRNRWDDMNVEDDILNTVYPVIKDKLDPYVDKWASGNLYLKNRELPPDIFMDMVQTYRNELRKRNIDFIKYRNTGEAEGLFGTDSYISLMPEQLKFTLESAIKR